MGSFAPKALNTAENDCSGSAPEGAGGGGWFKIYSSGANNWSWSTNTSDNDAHQIYARFDDPGVYNILVSARSSSHAIDRMVLYHSDYSGNPLEYQPSGIGTQPGRDRGCSGRQSLQCRRDGDRWLHALTQYPGRFQLERRGPAVRR